MYGVPTDKYGLGSTPSPYTRKYRNGKEIMSTTSLVDARTSLRSLTTQHASGKEGLEATIDAFAEHYKADDSIMPSEFLDLNKRQSVAHYGGYLVAHKGFTSSEVSAFANVIGVTPEKLDLSGDKATLMASLRFLDDQRVAEHTNDVQTALLLGDTTDKAGGKILDDIKAFRSAYAVTKTAKSQILLRKAAQELLDFLTDSE